MNITATTRISALLKESPDALEAIASINKHFEKLRNPLLRKVLAARVTIADAARIGGCDVELFYQKLAPLGFTVNDGANRLANHTSEITPATLPAYLAQLPGQSISTLDVRDAIAGGSDPFKEIMSAVTQVGPGKALLIINTFEPTPLLAILKKKGFSYHTETKNADLVYTYFWQENAPGSIKTESMKPAETDFETTLARFAGKVKRIDVRHLEMPQPMITILGELEALPADGALYVVHKRVPQFLLPQLKERGFNVAINEIGPNEVYLLIYQEAAL